MAQVVGRRAATFLGWFASANPSGGRRAGRGALLAGALALGTLVPGRPAVAQTAGGPPMTAKAAGATLGPIGGIRLGQSGVWTKSVAGGWFIMANSGDSNAIDFFDIRWRRTLLQGRAASVTVLVKGAPDSLAGLFIVNNANSHKWLALMLGGDGSVGLYLHDPGKGLKLLKRLTQAGAGDTQGVVLTVAQNTAETQFRVDHRPVLTMPVHYDPAKPHGGLSPVMVGLGAARTGTFGFRSFAFVPVGLAAPTPQAATTPQQVPNQPGTDASPFPPVGPAPAAPAPVAPAPAPGASPFPPAGAPPAPGANPFPPAGAPPAPGANPFPPAGAPPAPGASPFPPAATPPAPAPAPGGNGQSMSLAQFFVGGYWRNVVTNGQESEETDFSFNADGTYRERDTLRRPTGQISVDLSGRWSVQPVQGSTVMLSIQPQQAYPPQICGAGGNCRPVPLKPQQFQVTLLGRNSISYNGQTVRRLQQ